MEDWESRAVFRETFLTLLGDGVERHRALEMGQYFYDLLLEAAPAMPGPAPASVLVSDLRAVARDLEFARDYLQHLGEAPQLSQLRPRELELARFAPHGASRVAEAAREIRAMLEATKGLP